MPAIGPQLFAQTIAVATDQCIGRAQNMAVGTVILLQFNHVALREFLLKQTHIFHARAAKRIDGLIVIAHRHHGGIFSGQQFEPCVLQSIGILKLIDQNV